MEEEIQASKMSGDVINKALQRELKAADVKIKDKDLKGALNTNTAPQQ
jgi:foldase protein PrsA